MIRANIILIALCQVGCGASWRNAQEVTYLEQHPLVEYCVLEQGVDPKSLEQCIFVEIHREPEAARWCIESPPMAKDPGSERRERAWRAVEMCEIAGKAHDQIVADWQEPAREAASLGMIGLGQSIMQGPPRMYGYPY